jgi:tetratricopeptide (TPR) repeat protein
MKAFTAITTRSYRRFEPFGSATIGAVMLMLVFGCSPRKETTERDRKEAALLMSEAQFAMTLKDWARAEGLLDRAAKASPQGDYYLSLGAVRMQLKNRSGAKKAYELAVNAFQQETARNNTSPEPWIKQAYALGLLGRRGEIKPMIEKARKALPNDPKIRALTDPKELERIFSTQSFKDMAL